MKVSLIALQTFAGNNFVQFGKVGEIKKYREHKLRSKLIRNHCQLLNILIFKFNTPVLLNQLGIIFPYCPVDRAIRRIDSFSIDLPGRLMLEL